MKGKIIAIMGASRSGKSYLAKKIAKEFNAELFLEGEEGEFPTRIVEDIQKNIRPLERILWFRDMLIKRYVKALELKKQGKNVVLDVFWLSNDLFFDVLLEGFELELMRERAAIDRMLLPFPDLTIFLKTSEQGIRNFVTLGGRSYDQSEEVLIEQLLPINDMHEKFFANPPTGLHVLTIDRTHKDFDREEDFAEVLSTAYSALRSID